MLFKQALCALSLTQSCNVCCLHGCLQCCLHAVQMLSARCTVHVFLPVPDRLVWLQSRLALEVVNIFCHGGSVKTLHQLWNLHMLDVMMPPFVLYLQHHKIKR